MRRLSTWCVGERVRAGDNARPSNLPGPVPFSFDFVPLGVLKAEQEQGEQKKEWKENYCKN